MRIQSSRGIQGLLVAWLMLVATSRVRARQGIGPDPAPPRAAAVMEGPGTLLITRSAYVVEARGGVARVAALLDVRTVGSERAPAVPLFRGDELAVEQFDDGSRAYHLAATPDPAGSGATRLDLMADPGAARSELKILLQVPLRTLGEKVQLSMHVPEVPMTQATFRFPAPPRQLEVPFALRPPALQPAAAPPVAGGAAPIFDYVVPLIGSGRLEASWLVAGPAGGGEAAPAGERWRVRRADTLIRVEGGAVRGVGRYVLETISGPLSDLEVALPPGTRFTHRGHALLEDDVLTRSADDVRVIRFRRPLEGEVDLEVDWSHDLRDGAAPVTLPRFIGAQFRAVGSIAICNQHDDRVRIAPAPGACVEALEPSELPADAFRDPRLPIDLAYRQTCGDLLLMTEKTGPVPVASRGRARVMEITTRFPDEKQDRVRYQGRLVLEPGFRGDLFVTAPTTDWKLDEATLGDGRVEVGPENGGYRLSLGHPGSWDTGSETVLDLQFSEQATSNGKLGRLTFHLPRLDIPVGKIRLALREPEGLQLHGIEGSFDQCLSSHVFFLRGLAEELRRGLALSGQGLSVSALMLSIVLLGFQLFLIRSYLTRRLPPTLAAAGTGLVLVLALGVAIGRRPPTLVAAPGISDAIDMLYGQLGNGGAPGSDLLPGMTRRPAAPPAGADEGATPAATAPASPAPLPAGGVEPVALPVPGTAPVEAPAGPPPEAPTRVFTRAYTPPAGEAPLELTLAVGYAVPSLEHVMKVMGVILGVLLFLTLFCSLRELAEPRVIAAAATTILVVTWAAGLWFPAIHRSFALGFSGPSLLMAFLKLTARAREQLEAWKEEGERAHLERHPARRRGRPAPARRPDGPIEADSEDPHAHGAIPHARPANQVPIQEALAEPPEEDEITFIVEEDDPAPPPGEAAPPPGESRRKEEPES